MFIFFYDQADGSSNICLSIFYLPWELKDYFVYEVYFRQTCEKYMYFINKVRTTDKKFVWGLSLLLYCIIIKITLHFSQIRNIVGFYNFIVTLVIMFTVLGSEYKC